MSRAVHILEIPATIEELCKKHALRVSTIEPLLSGGSRAVMLDPKDADTLRGLMKSKLIAGDVKRSPSHLARQPPPYGRR